jgi:hypothetical protein
MVVRSATGTICRRADRLNTDADLDRWVQAVESLVPATRRLATV